MKKLLNLLFNRWSKYTLYSKNVVKTRQLFNPLLGIISEQDVLVDVYVKEHKYNGICKFKYVEK